MLLQYLISLALPHLLLTSYVGIPALLGVLAHHRLLLMRLSVDCARSAEKLRQWLAFKLRPLSTEDYLTYSIYLLMSAFFLLAAVQLITHAVKAYAVWIIVAFLAISFSILATIRYRLVVVYKKMSWLVNVSLLLIGLYVANESAAICDDTIAEFTNVNASNFPAAQRALTSLITVGYWVIYSTFASLAVCCLLMLVWIFSTVTHSSRQQSKSKYIPGVTNRPTGKAADPRAPRVHFSLLISLLYVTVTVTTYFTSLTPQKINGMAKHILVKYSFHVSPTVCGLVAPSDSKVSLLSDKQAVLALPDATNTYRFVVFQCERTLNKFPEVQGDLTGTLKLAAH